MKKAVLILLVTLFVLPIIAQTRDIIHLKNGSIIKGQIKEMNPSGNIKIKTSDGSVFVYKMTEVVKMVKEEVSKPTPSRNISSNMLSRAEAKTRIVAVYGYPKDQLWRVTVDDGSAYWRTDKAKNQKFVDAGLMKDNDPSGQSFLSQHYYAELTPKGEMYRRSNKYNIYGSGCIDLKVAEYEFVKITGILQEPNSSRASVNYTIKRINVNPLGKLIHNNTTNKSTKKLLKEETLIDKTAHLIKYDDGWRVVEDDEIRKMSRYVNKEKELAKKIKELEKSGNYKKSDIADFTPSRVFLKANDIPIFDEVGFEYALIKSPKGCSTCRNDNIRDLEKAMKRIIKITGRFSNETKETFKKNSNISKITVEIKDIKYTHKGFTKEGKDRGFSCEIQYDILINTLLSSPKRFIDKNTIFMDANSGLFKYCPDKQNAFYEALESFKSQFLKFIFKRTPFCLPLKSIEVDKKGRPKYITFHNPKVAPLKRKKTTFYIIERSSLSIMNNKFKIKESIGKVTYRKSKFPKQVKIKIRGRKLKKALKNYIGKENNLIGISK